MLIKQNFLQTELKSMLVILFVWCFTSIGLAQSWTPKAPMPTARGWLSTCTVNNNIYAVGGATDIGSNLDVLEAYDPSTNTWTTKTPMPTPRGCAAACAVDGIIYVFGGGWYTVYSTVEAYDPSTDTWTTKSPMPTARSGLSVCVVDSIIYAISGFTDMNNPLSTNTVEAYDPKTDTWTTKAPIPTVRAYFTTSVVDGIIYTFGGFNSRNAPSLGNVEAYDPVSDVWTIKNDMPIPKAGMASYASGGNIYCFGGVGYGGGPCFSTVSKYDPASDNWEDFSNMPYAAFSISSSLLNGKVYFIGGLNNDRTPLDIVYEYTPPTISYIEAGNVSGTWTLANSPYHINGEITIPNDSTLTIEPGVKVVFTGHYKFNVQGRLLAIGTETDTILFTINDTTGYHDLNIPYGGWGGIRFVDTPPTNDSSKVIYCKLQYGKANTGISYDRVGGTICAKFNKLLVSHCLFRNNTTYHPNIDSTAGGAIYIEGNPTVEFCEFIGNTGAFGGAICIWGSNIHPLIRNNYFHHNGGHGTINIGSWNGSNTSPVLINNIIVNNHSSGHTSTPDGHGIVHFSNGGGTAVLINNTIVNNSCAGFGGAIFTSRMIAAPLLINNIIYGNLPAQVKLNATSSMDFYNCLIEGGHEGFSGSAFTGTYSDCIDVDPLFVSSNDYRLQNTSPCIGTGLDSIQIGSLWYHCPANDYDGNPRPNPTGSMPDIGAYEHELGNPATAVEGEKDHLPTKFALEQNYPNPFNPSTTIKYSILSSSVMLNSFQHLNDSEIPKQVRDDNFNVQLKIYDVLGSEVTTLVNEEKPAGTYEIIWNATNLPSGVYFYRLQAGKFATTKKLILKK